MQKFPRILSVDRALYRAIFVTFVILLLGLAPCTAVARPLAPEPDPYTVPLGAVQIQADLITYTRNDRHGERTRSLSSAFLAKYGVTNDLELQLGLDAFVSESVRANGDRDRVRGIGRSAVGFKANLFGNDADNGTALSIRSLLDLPTMSWSPERRLWLGRLELPFASEPIDGVSLEWTPAIAVAEHSSALSRTTELGSLLSLNVATFENIDSFVEWEQASFREKGRGPESYVNVGITAQLTESLVLEPAAQFGVTRSADDLRLLTTIVARY